jgi:threonylcarbamoyladenosine tRNA methylthiotransferase MtaB
MSVPKVALATLGCKVNQYETQVLREYLLQAGFREVPFKEKADFYIINTCSVTETADRKSEELIKVAKKNGSAGRLIVAGCYAEAEGKRIKEKFPGVDVVLGNPEKLKLDKLVGLDDPVLIPPKPSISDFYQHNRAFVKIEDGCHEFCTYCRIPYVRGNRIRSRSTCEVLAEIENLIQKGFKEIVLAGVNLGLYGEDLPSSESLVHLLKRLQHYGGGVRFRLSSLEPHLVTSNLLELIGSSSSICPHLHLPLQSGDDYILQRMGRKYTLDKYRRLVEEARDLIPQVAITTDVMVGFPGEEEYHFQSTYRFLEEIHFSRLHVFRFSPRPGTRAFSMRPQVEAKTQRKRSEELRRLGNALSQRFAVRFLGKSLRVLVEEKRHSQSGLLMGYTDNYIRIFLEGKDELKNRLLKVRMVEIKDWGGVIGKAEAVDEGA